MIEAIQLSQGDMEKDKKMNHLYRAKQSLDEAVAYYREALSAQPGYREDELDIGNYAAARSVLEKYEKTLLQFKTQTRDS